MYFAGDSASLYQLREWLPPVEQLARRLRAAGTGDEPVAIFCRSAEHAQRIAQQTHLPVRFGRLTRDLDAFMRQPNLRLVFYVNQATMNFQALRYTQPAHVHLSHGESEKISMISNQLKAYDYIFTAGQAARDRLLRTLVGFREQGGEARMVDVGRPQLDGPRQAPRAWQEMTADERLTVFYAPTWEGDSPSMAYGTLKHNGPAIVRGLLDAGCRVIFRPHPRTGVLDVETAQALAAVSQLVTEHPRGYLDDDARLGWQFDAADVCLTEMSALAFDWLATGKPLVLIRPDDPRAEVIAGGLFDRVPAGGARESQEVVQMVTATAGVRQSPQVLQAQSHYLGDTQPGRQQARFEEAAENILNERGVNAR
ncbi:hypothetical protein F7P83_07360 [Brevibacterium luteolum]|nr:hypothetical protein [Brevibacterium luteolum]